MTTTTATFARDFALHPVDTPAHAHLPHDGTNVTATATFEAITPDLAQAILNECNIDNRNPREQQVRRLVKDMNEGRWHMTGAPISFDRDGNLLDGQHRLLGTVRSNTTQTFLVVRGLDPEAREAIDTGSRRTFSDLIQCCNVPVSDPKHAGAVATRLWAFDGGCCNTAYSIIAYPNHGEAMAYLNDHLDAIVASAQASKAWSSTHAMPSLPSSWLGALHAILSRVDAADAHRFFEGIATSSLDGADDPRQVLLRTLRTPRTDITSPSRSSFWAFITFRTWNAWRRGEALTTIRINSHGSPIEMPHPI